MDAAPLKLKVQGELQQSENTASAEAQVGSMNASKSVTEKKTTSATGQPPVNIATAVAGPVSFGGVTAKATSESTGLTYLRISSDSTEVDFATTANFEGEAKITQPVPGPVPDNFAKFDHQTGESFAQGVVMPDPAWHPNPNWNAITVLGGYRFVADQPFTGTIKITFSNMGNLTLKWDSNECEIVLYDDQNNEVDRTMFGMLFGTLDDLIGNAHLNQPAGPIGVKTELLNVRPIDDSASDCDEYLTRASTSETGGIPNATEESGFGVFVDDMSLDD